MNKLSTEQYIKVIKTIFGHNKQYPDRQLTEWNLIKEYGEVYINKEELDLLFDYYNSSENETEKTIAGKIKELSKYDDLQFSLTYFMLFLSSISYLFSTSFILNRFTHIYPFERLVIRSDNTGLFFNEIKEKGLPIYLENNYFFNTVPLDFLYNAEFDYLIKDQFLNCYLIGYVNKYGDMKEISGIDPTNFIGIKYNLQLQENKKFTDYICESLKESEVYDTNAIIFVLYFFSKKNLSIPENIKSLLCRKFEIKPANFLLMEIQKIAIKNYSDYKEKFGDRLLNIYKEETIFIRLLDALKNLYGDLFFEKIGLIEFNNQIDINNYTKTKKNKDWIAFVFHNKIYPVINYFCENGFVLNSHQKKLLKPKSQEEIDSYLALKEQLQSEVRLSFIDVFLDKELPSNLKKLEKMQLTQEDKDFIFKCDKDLDSMLPDIIPDSLSHTLRNNEKVSLLNRMIFNKKLEKVLILTNKGVELEKKQKKWLFYLIAENSNNNLLKVIFNYINKLTKEDKRSFINIVLDVKMNENGKDVDIKGSEHFNKYLFELIKECEDGQIQNKILMMMLFYKGEYSHYFFDIYHHIQKDIIEKFLLLADKEQVLEKSISFLVEHINKENSELKFYQFSNAIEITIYLLNKESINKINEKFKIIEELAKKNKNIIKLLNHIENIKVKDSIYENEDGTKKKKKRI